jgi:hypothetical protein
MTREPREAMSDRERVERILEAKLPDGISLDYVLETWGYDTKRDRKEAARAILAALASKGDEG